MSIFAVSISTLSSLSLLFLIVTEYVSTSASFYILVFISNLFSFLGYVVILVIVVLM